MKAYILDCQKYAESLGLQLPEEYLEEFEAIADRFNLPDEGRAEMVREAIRLNSITWDHRQYPWYGRILLACHFLFGLNRIGG